MQPWVFLGVLPAAPAAAQTARKAAALLDPVRPVEVTGPGGAILRFRRRSGATEVLLKGTPLAPAPQGRLKVESKQGCIELDANRNSFTGPSFASSWPWTPSAPRPARPAARPSSSPSPG